MSNRLPLMPKATAVWLVDNTGLTFDQIAHFCGLHVLEVKGIADGEVAGSIKGNNPVTSGQLTREEIERGENNPAYDLKLAEPKVTLPEVSKRKRGPRYTPVSRRQDRPNAIQWLLKNHPELRDAQIIRLVGTTKPTITQIRDRTHWNSANLVPQDPVTLGLCTQIDLDAEVQKAAEKAAKEGLATGPGEAPGGSLLPTAETTDYGLAATESAEPADQGASHAEEEARMFAKLSSMSSGEEGDEAAEPVETAENVFAAKPAAAVEAPTSAEEPNDAFETAQAASDAVETPEQAEGDPPPVTEAMTDETSEAANSEVAGTEPDTDNGEAGEGETGEQDAGKS